MGKFLTAMKPFIHKLVPFIILGITLFIFIIGLVIVSYIFIVGALIGLVLFVAQWLREKFASQKISKMPKKVDKKGRTIDHDHI
jgi:uncharacterized membrane protein